MLWFGYIGDNLSATIPAVVVHRKFPYRFAKRRMREKRLAASGNGIICLEKRVFIHHEERAA